jgi:tetratricopeptide (TPR) repeat protein
MNSFVFPQAPNSVAEESLMFEPDAVRSLKEKAEKLPSYSRFSSDQIEIIYCVAYSMYMQGKIESACSVFQILLIYRPLDIRILAAFGLCCKQLGMFEQAIPALTSAFLLDSSDVKLAVHISECLAALGKREESLKILEPILQLSELEASFDNVQKRAEALKSLMIGQNR